MDANDKVKYLPGEIDFILRRGNRVIPIEVKAGRDRSNFNLKNLENLLQENRKIPFGIVLYGGVPYTYHKRRLLFWPWWLV